MNVRVGMGLGPISAAGLGGAGLLQILDECERLGWDSIWFSERVTGDLIDPLAAMAAAAARTKRLKFGPSVLVLPGRNPVLLAKQLASIDVISGGRLLPAFGLGTPDPAEHVAFGTPREEAGARTEEAAALMHRLWTQERVTHEGRFFRTKELTLRPRPVQRDLPIWFGGESSAAIRRVAELGSGWLPAFLPPDRYAEKAHRIRELAARAGRSLEEDHYGALIAYVPRGGRGAERVIDAFAARRPDVDVAGAVVPEGESALSDRIDAYVAAGASKFVLMPLVPPPDWIGELRRLREEVAIPAEGGFGESRWSGTG